MFTALVSLLTGIRVRHDVAMTGEITLRGLVLPVGGIKEKVLAAHRAGIKRVIIPERNEKDLVDVPEEARKELEFVFAAHMDEVLEAALEEDPVGRQAPGTPEPEGEKKPGGAKKPEEVEGVAPRPAVRVAGWSGSRSSPARPARSRTPSRRRSGVPVSRFGTRRSARTGARGSRSTRAAPPR